MEQVGKQSSIDTSYRLIPPLAIDLLAQVLKFGADKYGVENWKLIPVEDHLDHCLDHIYKFIAGDETEPHLVNALARLTFLIELLVEDGAMDAKYTNNT